MMKYIVLTGVVVILSGIFWYGYFWYREKQLIDRLQEMLRQAESGKLERDEISETKFSALQNSLKRYLDDSLLSGEKQKQQKSMIQGLISDISHQTLTPVSNLKIYSGLLKEQLAAELAHANSGERVDAKGLEETADTITEQTEKLDFLIQSLVKLSRMENGIISVHPKQTAVSELLEGLKRQFCKKAREKQLQFTLCKTDVCAQFDLKWTLEAVGNIVDNAMKYTEEGGQVSIEVIPYAMFVRIDITDTGIGIKEAEIPKIFTRFYRSLSVAELPGVGIGLYLAREIIQAQKGYIKVTSKVGHGSVFSVFLLQ